MIARTPWRVLQAAARALMLIQRGRRMPVRRQLREAHVGVGAHDLWHGQLRDLRAGVDDV
jgi:hypothetical protein